MLADDPFGRRFFVAIIGSTILLIVQLVLLLRRRSSGSSGYLLLADNLASRRGCFLLLAMLLKSTELHGECNFVHEINIEALLAKKLQHLEASGASPPFAPQGWL